MNAEMGRATARCSVGEAAIPRLDVQLGGIGGGAWMELCMGVVNVLSIMDP